MDWWKTRTENYQEGLWAGSMRTYTEIQNKTLKSYRSLNTNYLRMWPIHLPVKQFLLIITRANLRGSKQARAPEPRARAPAARSSDPPLSVQFKTNTKYCCEKGNPTGGKNGVCNYQIYWCGNESLFTPNGRHLGYVAEKGGACRESTLRQKC